MPQSKDLAAFKAGLKAKDADKGSRKGPGMITKARGYARRAFGLSMDLITGFAAIRPVVSGLMAIPQYGVDGGLRVMMRESTGVQLDATMQFAGWDWMKPVVYLGTTAGPQAMKKVGYAVGAR